MGVRSDVIGWQFPMSGSGATDQFRQTPDGFTCIVKRIELWNAAGATRAIEWRLGIAGAPPVDTFRRDSLTQLSGLGEDVWWVVPAEWSIEGMQAAASSGLNVILFGAMLIGEP